MFIPETKHSVVCNACLKKIHKNMVLKKRAKKENGKK